LETRLHAPSVTGLNREVLPDPRCRGRDSDRERAAASAGARTGAHPARVSTGKRHPAKHAAALPTSNAVLRDPRIHSTLPDSGWGLLRCGSPARLSLWADRGRRLWQGPARCDVSRDAAGTLSTPWQPATPISRSCSSG